MALVSLDRRARARAQMLDANALFDQLVLPSCLPWSQCQNMLYKTLPRDIDDLCSELFEETEETAVAYRSSDPGVVELNSCEVDTTQGRNPKRKRYEMDARAEIPSTTPGEWSLQMYHEVQWNERQRQEHCITKKRSISIRVGSTSSRASLFDSSRAPLFLMALYPRQLHEGTKRHGLEAFKYGMDLGSYNCRSLPPEEAVLLSDIPSSKQRFSVGRSRIIWSEKERPESKSQRCAYRSVLNGQRLETTSLKRPLQVKVGIRINKVLLSYPGSRSNRPEDSAVSSQNKKILELSSNSYSNKVIQDSLDFACGPVETKISQQRTLETSDVVSHDYSQCTLHLKNYVAKTASDYLTMRGDSILLVQGLAAKSLNEPFTIERLVSVHPDLSNSTHVDRDFLGAKAINDGMHASEKSRSENSITRLPNGDHGLRLRTHLHVVPPRFEFLPTEDGRMHVTCTLSGTMKHETQVDSPTADCLVESSDAQPSRKPSSVLLRVLSRETKRCVICWNTENLTKDSARLCQGCHVFAHSSCVNVSSQRWTDHDDWLCSCCAHMGDERTCSVCHFSEGILLPWKENQWIHNVCRTWCGSNATARLFSNGLSPKDSTMGSCCHLCSKGDSAVVVCLGEGCSVSFHPMCALVASMAEEIRCFELNEPPPQYTLTMMRTSFTLEREAAHSKLLPVAFCPYHAPVHRCPPMFDSSSVRIPPRRRQWELQPSPK